MTADMEMDLASGIAAFEAKNFSQARALLAPLARQSAPEAQYRLAIIHQNGLGTVRNESPAEKWMRAAAEQNHAPAQHGLGIMYLQGDCVRKDLAAAADWLERAAAQGMAGSQTMLAMIREGAGE